MYWLFFMILGFCQHFLSVTKQTENQPCYMAFSSYLPRLLLVFLSRHASLSPFLPYLPTSLFSIPPSLDSLHPSIPPFSTTPTLSLVLPRPVARACLPFKGVRGAIRVGDLGGAASYVRRFREIDAGALADSTEMVEMDEAVKG